MKGLLFALLSINIAIRAEDACVPLDGGRIHASDLALRFPVFTAIPGTTDLGPAPIPGVRRWVFPPELAQWGRRSGLSVKPSELREICLSARMQRLQPTKIVAAISESLREWNPSATFEIDNQPNYEVPAGAVEFPLSGLARPGNEVAIDGPLLWKGRIVYGTRASFPIWAKIRIHAERDAVVALTDLPAGKLIPRELVGVQRRAAHPRGPMWVVDPEAVIGRTPRRLIPAGEPLTAECVVSRLEVQKGNRVQVQVAAGAARLSFAAISESDGRIGEMVTVRNPFSGKRFKGKIIDKSTILVTASGKED